MEYKEVYGNLFDAPQGFCLAHCIAGDFGMSAGIATQFNDKFNMKNRLKESYGAVESPMVLKIDNVFNLITKNKSWEKPTYDSLMETLIQLRNMMIEDGDEKLAIPQIGCGLDKLSWNVVRELIVEVFQDTEISITVYIYDENKSVEDCPSSVKIFGNSQEEKTTFYDDDDIKYDMGYMDNY